jgi:copper(I)-binding protein
MERDMTCNPSFARSAASGFCMGLLAAASLTAAATPSLADTYKVGPHIVTHVWARATPPGAKVAGGYLTIQNTGDEADTLVSATAEIAGRVEVHEMAVVDGVMKMRHLENGLEIPAGGSVELKPGSYHIMLMDLAQPLVEGETFDGTLTFEKAGTVDVTYEIGAIGSSAAPENDHNGMMMDDESSHEQDDSMSQ